MKVNIKKLIIYIIILFNISVNSYDEYENKKIEKLWDFDSADRKPIEIDKKQSTVSKSNLPPFLSVFTPEKQEFQIVPQTDNVINGKNGTTIFIPANSISLPMSFRRGDIVVLELVEVLNDLDYLTSGVDLNYTDSRGSNYILETGGMVKMNISYYSKPLVLKKGARLRLNIPMKDNTKQMKVYKIDDMRDAWVEKGSDDKPTNPSESKDRITNYMDDLQWWGFNSPNSETTCITGTIETSEKNPPYSIAVIGLDYKNVLVKNFTTLEFSMNSLKDKKIKVIAMDEKGNMGVSGEILTNGERVYLVDEKQSSKCLKIGSISLKKVSTDIRQNRNKFLNFIGIKED
jgi:hypothetical protein